MIILNPRFIHKTAKLCFLLLIILTSMVKADVVRGDIAPPGPPAGTNPIPDSEPTNVRMVSETVLIEIDADSPLDKGLGKVTATFTMRNLGDVDEQMDVRFPLDQTFDLGNLCGAPFFIYPSISDLKARVNGHDVATQNTYQAVPLSFETEPPPTTMLPCWAYFPVSFPVGKDVIIQVTYTAEPYISPNAAYGYSYVLITGDGWKGTIGTVDIMFQVPYELNDSNFISCSPHDCKVSENKIQWHYEDFNPSDNVNVSLLPPPLWQSILVERKNIDQNPKDGEAWGRLGKAYKGSIMARRGFRYDEVGQEMYRLSRDAYQQAVTLLPNDADWHYGYAELLCWNAEWDNFLVDSNEDAWRACVEQVQQVLNINPNHEKMKKLLEDYGQFDGMIDFSGPKPDYIILTPKPTNPAPVGTSTQNAVPATAIPSSTTEPAMTATLAETTVATLTTTPIEMPNASSTPVYVGGGILLIVAVLMFVKFRKK
ncbi:MAG: DUF4424 family protein [Chloroflexi bacterium]|nr:DUF4424 family protein [Chloroflexota bacterium]